MRREKQCPGSLVMRSSDGIRLPSIHLIMVSPAIIRTTVYPSCSSKIMCRSNLADIAL